MKRYSAFRYAMFGLAIGLVAQFPARSEERPRPVTDAIAGEDAVYYLWPDAALALDPERHYRAVFDVSKAIENPAKRSPILLRLARYFNGFSANKVPVNHVNFVVVFHGPGADAVLTDAAYEAKHKMANPNRALIERLQKLGVRTLICGQYVGGRNIPQADIMPGVEIAEAATLILVALGNEGYTVITD